MSRFLSILILVGILSQTFNTFVTITAFQLNREYIAENLCVKKDEPDNCCKGSCHLKKQLEEEEEKEKSPAAGNNKEIKEIIQLFCQQGLLLGFSDFLSLQRLYAPYQVSAITSPSFSIFHPPNC